MDEEIELAAKLICQAKNIVAFTGAGMSQESGIPTFRDRGGLWDRYAPEKFASVSGLQSTAQNSPFELLGFIKENIAMFLGAQPNKAHQVLAGLDDGFHHLTIVTQNVDDLHEQAGGGEIYKLHGDLYTFRCLKCGHCLSGRRSALEELGARINAFSSADNAAATQFIHDILPKCPCGGFLRPDVVLFGEALPEVAWEAAREALIRAHLLLVIGTSAEVFPASSLPKLAYQMSIPVIEINPRPVLRHNAVTISANAAVTFNKIAAGFGG